MKVTFCTIALNEEQYLGANLTQHYDFCDRWIIVEGACAGYPSRNVTPAGLSTDSTADIIKAFPDPCGKIEHIQHGWTDAYGEDAKSELRNRYAELLGGEIVIVIDADEFYRRDALRMIVETMKDTDWKCWRIPQVHHWHSVNQIITGSYADVPHNRVYRWERGLRYVSNHNHPETTTDALWHSIGPYQKIPRCLIEIDDGVTHPEPCVHHMGFCKSPENTEDKNAFYVNRGEAVTRRDTTALRRGWFDGDPPDGTVVQKWAGLLPEVFEHAEAMR